MGKLLAAAVAAALVLSACTDDPEDVGFEGLPDPSESPEPSPNASAEAPDEIDVTTTPDEITPEWVTAVVNTILAEYGQMTAEILAMPVSDDPTLPDGFEERLAELFDGEYLDRRIQELKVFRIDQAAREELLPLSDFEGLRYSAQLVQFAESSCVIAVGRISQELSVRGGSELEYLSAVSLSPGAGSSSEANPTEWVMSDELLNTNPDGDPNPDSVMLESGLDDYGDALSHTCEDSQ